MLAKFLIVMVMIAILWSLASGVRHLVKGSAKKGTAKTDGLLKALILRIALSVSLFLLLFWAFSQGYIHPHPLR